MRLLRDLWATSRSRTAMVALLILLGAAGCLVATVLRVAGPVLRGRR